MAAPVYRVQTRLHTERWWVFIGWAAPAPIGDSPAVSSVSERVSTSLPQGISPDAVNSGAEVAVIVPGVTDADGWVYALNCDAFPSIDAQSGEFVRATGGALNIEPHSTKRTTDCVRQRVTVRVSLLELGAGGPRAQCIFALVPMPPKRADDADVDTDPIAEVPTNHELELRNKSNSLIHVALYSRVACDAGLYRRVDAPAPLQLGFNSRCCVQSRTDIEHADLQASLAAADAMSTICVFTAREAELVVTLALGQLNHHEHGGTGVLLYAPLAAHRSNTLFIVTEQGDAAAAHPSQVLSVSAPAPASASAAAAAAAESSLASVVPRSDLVVVRALSHWRWAVVKRTGAWATRREAVARQCANFDRIAHAEHQPGVSAGERAYAEQRWQRCVQALRRFFHRPGDAGADAELDDRDLPRIGLCYSGGGLRALINGVGATLGADSIGLYDACLYSSGLSGGSWFLSLWTERPPASSGRLGEFVESLRSAFTSHPALIGPQRSAHVWEALQRVTAFKHNNEVAMSDIYGLLIAAQWFDTLNAYDAHRMDRVLSAQTACLAECDRPVPIYTAVNPNPALPGGYEWYEFTPWAVRALDSCVAVPAWAFGRRFSEGASIESCPEFPLGVLLGMFGSAFCASVNEIISNVGHEHPVLFSLIRGLASTRFVAPPRHYNVAYNHVAPSLAACTAHAPVLDLVDAGVCVNAPLPPLVRDERALDVVFVFDARPTDFDANDSKDVLRKWLPHARAKGLKAPRVVEFDGIGARSMTIIADDDPDASGPLLVYMPLVKNTTFSPSYDPATTANFMDFSFTEMDFDLLTGCAKLNVQENADAIRELLLQIAARKRAKRVAGAAEAGGPSGAH